MKQPICLITGATEGVGRATALELARRGFRVVFAARSPRKAEALKQEIQAATGAVADDIRCDLASLRQVRQLAETFRARYQRLDVLINNAGVFLPRRTQTEDGCETTFQVNYLSHFVLTHLVLDQLKQAEQGRIINLSSSVHAFARFDAQNLQSEKRFSVFGTYAASKLLMLMFTRELATRLAGTAVTANAVHPGIVRTPMMLRSPGAFRVVAFLSLPFSISPATGAKTSVHVATAPELARTTGQYFARSKPSAAKNRFDTEANRALLWDLSAKAVTESAVPARRAG
jgi:NAD(P)-dependent dehydrogenase (short-subunit alcohol dehydrogenase family)